MNGTVSLKTIMPTKKRMGRYDGGTVNLTNAQANREYIIKDIKTDDLELKGFLFTLGCYEGEKVTLLSVLGDNYIITIKDAKYSIDRNLAEAILVSRSF